MLLDQYQRIANYLRIGVTDRCNLRCRYCMPEQGIDFAHRNDLLSYEEITRLAQIFRGLGVEKVRLTGGEPFVRKGIDQLIQQLCSIFPKVHITTNATLLDGYIEALKDMGVASLNISIDSLDRERFFSITRRDDYIRVMQNIQACLDAELSIKLNIVVMKGINDMELVDFIEFGMNKGVEVRFIEAMPFNEVDGNKDVFMPCQDIEAHIKANYPSMNILPSDGPSSSNLYQIGAYRFGIIPAYSRSLCGQCNRIRLTPKGEFLTCLYAKKGLNLLELLRNEGYNNDMIREAIVQQVQGKLKSGFDEEAKREERIFNSMTTIGG